MAGCTEFPVDKGQQKHIYNNEMNKCKKGQASDSSWSKYVSTLCVRYRSVNIWFFIMSLAYPADTVCASMHVQKERKKRCTNHWL